MAHSVYWTEQGASHSIYNAFWGEMTKRTSSVQLRLWEADKLHMIAVRLHLGFVCQITYRMSTSLITSKLQKRWQSTYLNRQRNNPPSFTYKITINDGWQHHSSNYPIIHIKQLAQICCVSNLGERCSHINKLNTGEGMFNEMYQSY